EAAPGTAADHVAAPDHPHRWLRLRYLECRNRPIHGTARRPRNHLLPERGAGTASGFRAGREMGLRHQYRLGRQGRGTGERTEARRLFQRASVWADRHERHRVPTATEAVPERRSAGSLAWPGLGNTYFWIDPAAGVAGVILTQLLPFADRKALALLDAFERAVYAAVA